MDSRTDTQTFHRYPVAQTEKLMEKVELEEHACADNRTGTMKRETENIEHRPETETDNRDI